MSQLDIRRPTEGEIGYPLAPAELPQKGIVQILWRGRWYVFFAVLLLIGAGFFYASQQTPIYSSNSRIWVQPDTPKIISDTLTSSERTGNWLATQAELIKSQKILDGVVTNRLPIRTMSTFHDVDSPVVLIKNNLSAEVGIKDDLITISFECPYPSEAALVVNQVVEEFADYHRQQRHTTATEVLGQLMKAKLAQDDELKQKVKETLEFRRSHPNLTNAGEHGEIIGQQLLKVSDALATARVEVIEASGYYESGKAMAKDPSRMDQWMRQQAGNSPIGVLTMEVQRLEIDLVAKRQAIGTNHVETLKAQAQLDEMKSRVAEQTREYVDSYVEALKQRFEMATRREEDLSKAYEAQRRIAGEFNSESAELAMRDAEAKRVERTCDMLESRIKEVNIGQNDNAGVTITTYEVAKPSAFPIKPKKSNIIFEAIGIGLAIGCGLAYLREWMDHRLGSLDEIRALLNLNVIGVLPHMPGRETPQVRGQKVQLDPMSEIAEGYRTIRTAVYFGAPEGRTKTILITSPAPGDGKSTSASNLAIAMAQAGQRVLLLDADFRKPVQHKTFGMEDGLGLTSVVAGQVALSKVVKPTATKGLYLLPCGPIPRNPSEILNSQTFAQLMGKLKEKFDHIVVDSPPVVPVTDARILGASMDVTILVVRAQKSTRKVTLQARDSLQAVGSRILGLIVNDVPRGRSGYDFYAYGYYRRPYGNIRSAKSLEGKTNGARLPTPVGADDDEA